MDDAWRVEAWYEDCGEGEDIHGGTDVGTLLPFVRWVLCGTTNCALVGAWETRRSVAWRGAVARRVCGGPEGEAGLWQEGATLQDRLNRDSYRRLMIVENELYFLTTNQAPSDSISRPCGYCSRQRWMAMTLIQFGGKQY